MTMLKRLLASLGDGFDHGVHPTDHKQQTVDLAIQRVPFGREYILPLCQHIGAPAKAIVEAGQRVQRGQLIAEPAGFISSALHAPVSGVVKEVAPRRYTDGSFKQAVVIETDLYDPQQIDTNLLGDITQEWRTLDNATFIQQVQLAGIVGLGGAAFPSHVKYSIPDGIHINELLVNGAECEPYLTNDHRLMVEQSDRLLEGIAILMAHLGATHTTIGVESNKPQSIQRLRTALQQRPDLAVDVVSLEVKYPQGAEKMLIKAIYGHELPAGALPRDLGIAVNNVGTVVALANYFEHATPLIERVVTVAGPGITRPANLMVPLGTPIRDVLQYCGGLSETTREVIMGGPMMGTPIASLDAPILKGSSAILAFTAEQTAQPPEYPCIHCGRCLEACPYFLNPSKFARLGRARLYQQMEDHYHVMDCVECGSCTFACPSNIPIVQHIRTAKDTLRRRKKT